MQSINWFSETVKAAENRKVSITLVRDKLFLVLIISILRLFYTLVASKTLEIPKILLCTFN